MERKGEILCCSLSFIVVLATLVPSASSFSLGEKTFDVGSPFFNGNQNVEFGGGRPGRQPFQCASNSVFTRKCGVKPLFSPKNHVFDSAAYGEFPHHVALIRATDMKFLCSGALIDDLHVITAARCVAEVPEHDIILRMGEWDIMNDKNLQEVYFSIERTCVKAFIHPKYVSNSKAGSRGPDVAILRMDREVDFDLSPNVAPICLPEPTDFQFDPFGAGPSNNKLECYVTGWSDSPLLVLEAEYYRHFMDLDDDKRRKRAAEPFNGMIDLDPDFDLEDFADRDSVDGVIVDHPRVVNGPPALRRGVGPAFVADSPIFDDDFYLLDDDMSLGLCDLDLEDLIFQNALRTNGMNFPTSSAAIRNALRRRLNHRFRKDVPKETVEEKSRTKRDLVEYSKILSKGKVQIMDINDCRSMFGIQERNYLEDGRICLTSKTENRVCKADIGSPVVCFSKEKSHSRHARDTLILRAIHGQDIKAVPNKFVKEHVKTMFIAGIVSDTSCTQNTGSTRAVASATAINDVLDFICNVLSSH